MGWVTKSIESVSGKWITNYSIIENIRVIKDTNDIANGIYVLKVILSVSNPPTVNVIFSGESYPLTSGKTQRITVKYINSYNKTVTLLSLTASTSSSQVLFDQNLQTLITSKGITWTGNQNDVFEIILEEYADNAPTTPLSISAAGTFKTGETVTVSWGASMDPDGDVITYGLEVSINGGNYTQIYSGANRNFSYTIPNGTTKLAFRVRAYANGAYSGYQTSPTYNVKSNSLPIVTLNIENNLTLYENDTLTIAGSAYDSDADQSVTVYYQINDSQRKVLATNLSQTTITFNKQLKFSGGVLYDGDTAVSSALTDGVAYTLKVWAVDSDGAQSEVQTRTFYVVPNRAPTLTLDEVVPSGIIDSDKFTISGQAGDPDANANIKVSYRINNNNSVEVYNGPGDAFSFDVMLGQLNVGQNTITIEAADNYGAKYTKTIKLNKKEVKTPLLQSTARYKIEPPSGSAKGVLLWIQRHKNLQIDIKINMTLKGEPENFVSMSLENTAPVDNDIVEDEFFYEVDDSVDNIILQIDMTRSSIDVDDSIKLISGVLE